MTQLDLYTARSVAAERTAGTRRDADHRRLARERGALTATGVAARPGRGGLLSRLHLIPAHDGAL